jgi:hypothetical protein
VGDAQEWSKVPGACTNVLMHRFDSEKKLLIGNINLLCLAFLLLKFNRSASHLEDNRSRLLFHVRLKSKWLFRANQSLSNSSACRVEDHSDMNRKELFSDDAGDAASAEDRQRDRWVIAISHAIVRNLSCWCARLAGWFSCVFRRWSYNRKRKPLQSRSGCSSSGIKLGHRLSCDHHDHAQHLRTPSKHAFFFPSRNNNKSSEHWRTRCR